METKHDDGVCPHCGYCKHCGRGGHAVYPIYPLPWNPNPYPWWGINPPYWYGNSGTITVSAGTSSSQPATNTTNWNSGQFSYTNGVQ